MSELFRRIQALVFAGDVSVSDHGYGELQNDDLSASEAIDGISTGVVVEEYTERARGPAVLALQQDGNGQPVHVLWAVPQGARRPAVLVTAYRPDPILWDDEFRTRRRT